MVGGIGTVLECVTRKMKYYVLISLLISREPFDSNGMLITKLLQGGGESMVRSVSFKYFSYASTVVVVEIRGAH